MANTKMIKYMEVENVPTRLLNEILLSTGSREILNQVLLKENDGVILKKLRLKYKVNPKKKMSEEVLRKMALDYMDEDKTNKLYNIYMISNEKAVKEGLSDTSIEGIDKFEENIVIDNIQKILCNLEINEFICHMRKNQDLHKYIPAFIKTWIESDSFEKYGITDLCGFDYDKTLKEEFDIDLNLDFMEGYEDILRDNFKMLLKKSDSPLDFALDFIAQEINGLRDYMKENGIGDIKKEKEYEELIKENEALICEKDKELTKLKKDLNRVENQLVKSKELNESMKVELDKSNDKVDKIRLSLEEKTAKIDEMKKEKKESNRANNAVIKELEKERKLVEDKDLKIKELESIIEKQNEALKIKKDQLECLMEAYENVELEHDKRMNELRKFEQKERNYLDTINHLHMRLEEMESGCISTGVIHDGDEDGYDLGDDFLDSLLNDPTF